MKRCIISILLLSLFGIVNGAPLKRELEGLRDRLQTLLQDLQTPTKQARGVRLGVGEIIVSPGTSRDEIAQASQQYLKEFKSKSAQYFGTRAPTLSELERLNAQFNNIAPLLEQDSVENLVKLYVTLQGLSSKPLNEWDDAFYKLYLRYLFLKAMSEGWFDLRLLSKQEQSLFTAVYRILRDAGTITDVEYGYYQAYETPPPLPPREEEEKIKKAAEEVIQKITQEEVDIAEVLAKTLEGRRKSIEEEEAVEEGEHLEEWEREMFKVEEPEEEEKEESEGQRKLTADILEILRQRGEQKK